ncbi:MAG TPA: UDP-glucuronic acid decarboxylase family protein [Intrasporangium sp.]|uniref:UDP-glucuronic acid decarboxylase family protein n=1 Tax=Intrasporangium sp. TaxID=1925024 RepID=UPI002D792A50|nr:UDP-glucuronic acid decarboxylase family protein [Intrasporangium sp.]HET7397588.1 UDP-glucuronic acid decarboxylase family protein [Intrasporangium sp.]
MSATPPRRVVVTGGAGFVGSWLCEALLDDGASVVCVDNLLTGRQDNVADLLDRPGFEFLQRDICEPLDVPGDVDWVLHLASPASPPHYLAMPIETMRVGSMGTMNALDLAERKAARFVLASTSEVYGDPLLHPQPETYWGNVNPVGPRSVYDESKRFAEALTTAYRTSRGLDTGIVRIFNTYGPRMRLDDGRAIPAFLTQALAGDPITVAGDGSQTRSICFVTDTVAGIRALAAADDAGPVNIGSPYEVSMLELAETVRDLVGTSSEITFVPLPQDDPRVRRPDTARAERLLGWRPVVGPDEGLKRTLEWFRGQLEARRLGHPGG